MKILKRLLIIPMAFAELMSMVLIILLMGPWPTAAYKISNWVMLNFPDKDWYTK